MTKELLATVATYAEKSLLYEVTLSPKPGLVDRFSNGAHQDMDFYTFINSIQRLRPFFEEYLLAGYTHEGIFPKLFDQLRQIGIRAEKAMLEATNQINTHKGANFSYAILLGATGYHLRQGGTLPFSTKDTEQIFTFSKEIAAHLLYEDFADLSLKKKLSYGEKLYLDHGLTGIRGEAAKGYPSLQITALPFFRRCTDSSIENRLLRTLVYLMSTVEDGNLIHRGGLEAWTFVKEKSKKIHQAALPTKQLLDELHQFDLEMIARNLSPGGSADLIALTTFFGFMEGLI